MPVRMETMRPAGSWAMHRVKRGDRTRRALKICKRGGERGQGADTCVFVDYREFQSCCLFSDDRTGLGGFLHLLLDGFYLVGKLVQRRVLLLWGGGRCARRECLR